MKEIRYIFNTVAILACIASIVCFFTSIYYNANADNQMSVMMLEMFGLMFFVAFFFGIIGATIDD